MTTALAADRVWFNSAFHRNQFLAALDDLLLCLDLVFRGRGRGVGEVERHEAHNEREDESLRDH